MHVDLEGEAVGAASPTVTNVSYDNYHYDHAGGHLHRLDGPAIEWSDGGREWYSRGLRHRTDGPAVEDPDGHREWWVNGVHVSVAVRRYIAQGMSDADAITAALIDIERENAP